LFQSKSNTSIYICLGSNLGDRAGNLLLATRGLLEAGLKVTRLSAIYETEPVLTTPLAPEQPRFLNLVAELDCHKSTKPEQLMARLLRIEYALGRTRDVYQGPRTIDLDLLFYGNETRTTEFLTLPHPRLHQRRFALVPLSELAPNLVHPTLKKTIAELLSLTEDRSEVKRWHP
jgi:2-amino-4-hydroxy-6-hydroxymethyldihydropteridine diphosphokinase